MLNHSRWTFFLAPTIYSYVGIGGLIAYLQFKWNIHMENVK